VATTNDKPIVDAKTGTASQSGDPDTRHFIETHNVTKVVRKAVPGSGEESADLLDDDAAGPSNTGG